jgi:hypothetical protein
MKSMQKQITVKGHFRKVPGRARRVRIPAFNKTITIGPRAKTSQNVKEPDIQELYTAKETLPLVKPVASPAITIGPGTTDRLAEKFKKWREQEQR